MKSVAFVPTDARLGAGPGKMELREVPDPGRRRAGRQSQPLRHPSVALLNLLVQEQSIIGTFGYNEEFLEARDLITSSEVDVSPLISRTVSLDDLPATFEEITNDRNKYQKVLVRP